MYCTREEASPGRGLARTEGLLEEDHGLGIVADVPTLPGAPHEPSELGVAGGWFTVLDKPERVADVQDAFFENEAGETCGRRLPCRYDLCELGGGKATVEEYRLLRRRSDGSIGVYSAYHTALRIHLPQRPQGTNSRHDPLLLGPGEELFTLGEPRLGEIAPLGLRLRNFDFLDGVERLLQTQLLSQVAPAPGPLGDLGGLRQGEATAEFAEGACPVSAVEEEIPVPIRGNDDGVALHGIGRDLLAYASETSGVVGLVE